MGFIDELKRLARPYEDEEDDEFEDDFEPVSRGSPARGGRERGPKGHRATRSSVDPEDRRSNKVVNIHTTTQLQVVLVKPERFENASGDRRPPAGEAHGGAQPGVHQQGHRPPPAGLPVRRGLCPTRARSKKVAISTYIITPYNVDILGDLIDEQTFPGGVDPRRL